MGRMITSIVLKVAAALLICGLVLPFIGDTAATLIINQMAINQLQHSDTAFMIMNNARDVVSGIVALFAIAVGVICSCSIVNDIERYKRGKKNEKN